MHQHGTFRGNQGLDGEIYCHILMWDSSPTKINIFQFLSESLNTSLLVCYPLISTPWFWSFLSKAIFSLTVLVAFIATWCLMLIKPLMWGGGHIHLRTSHMDLTFPFLFIPTLRPRCAVIYIHHMSRQKMILINLLLLYGFFLCGFILSGRIKSFPNSQASPLWISYLCTALVCHCTFKRPV